MMTSSSIDFDQVLKAEPRDRTEVCKRIAESTDWKLSDLVLGPKGTREKFLATCIGQLDGGQIDTYQAVKKTFRLRVVSEQAVRRDGVRLLPSEKPQPGDEVWHSRGGILKDSRGRPMSADQLRSMAARGLPVKDYTKYVIDDAGCITVDILHGYEMLEHHGVGIGAVHFTGRGEKRVNDAYWFEEATDGDVAPKRRNKNARPVSVENEEASNGG